ncbi:hypothetical protein [Chloroflexus sp.]|uniref:hypothetical protein n=1 Tax=Chloroflexus sp. TaxID=1904827 RepID=UPI002613F369|nr:hypothetical protein [uncultured Chloroflexus sp.]
MSNQTDQSSSGEKIKLVHEELDAKKAHLYHIAAQAAYRALDACARQAVQELTNVQKHPIVLVDRIIDGRDAMLAERARAWLMSRQKRRDGKPDTGEDKADTTAQPSASMPALGASLSASNAFLSDFNTLVGTLNSLTDSVNNLLQRFKSDYALYRIDVSIDYAALAAAMAHVLCHYDWQVWHFPPLSKMTIDREQSIIDLINNLSQPNPADQNNFLNDTLEQFNTIYEKLAQALLPPSPFQPSAEGDSKATQTASPAILPPLARAILSEQLRHTKSPMYQLAVRILTVGSDMIMRKHIFSSGQLLFVGGCAIEYTLATADGRIIAANVVQSTERIKINLGNGKLTTELLGK